MCIFQPRRGGVYHCCFALQVPVVLYIILLFRLNFTDSHELCCSRLDHTLLSPARRQFEFDTYLHCAFAGFRPKYTHVNPGKCCS